MTLSLLPVLLLLGAVAHATDPGLRLRVTTKAIHAALAVAEQMVNDKLAHSKLPGVRLEVDVGPGRGRVDVRRLVISDFSPPTYHYEPMPPTAAQWTAANGSITVKGAWAARYSYLVQVSVDGYFIATISNLTMKTAIEVVKGVDGRAEVVVPNCKADIGWMKVKVVGGPVPKIINALRSAIEDAVMAAIREKVCGLVQSVVVTRLNSKIRSKPAHFPIQAANNTLAFNYSLVANPVVTDHYLDIPIDARTSLENHTDSVVPSAMPASEEWEKMVYLWVAESVPQSLINSAFEAGLLKFEVNRNATPQFSRGLRTTCHSSECFGSRLKTMGERFPDNYAVVEIWAAESPVVKFREERCFLNAQFLVKIYAEPKSEETTCLLAQINVAAKFRLFFKGQKLLSKMTFDTFAATVNETRVGPISGLEVYFISDIISAQIQEKVNQQLSRNAVDFSVIAGLELNEPQINVDQGVVKIATDFRYVPVGD